jgi:hypothetical protein
MFDFVHSNAHTRVMVMPDKKCEKFSDHQFVVIDERNLGQNDEGDWVVAVTEECKICGEIDSYREDF